MNEWCVCGCGCVCSSVLVFSFNVYFKRPMCVREWKFVEKRIGLVAWPSEEDVDGSGNGTGIGISQHAWHEIKKCGKNRRAKLKSMKKREGARERERTFEEK